MIVRGNSIVQMGKSEELGFHVCMYVYVCMLVWPWCGCVKLMIVTPCNSKTKALREKWNKPGPPRRPELDDFGGLEGAPMTEQHIYLVSAVPKNGQIRIKKTIKQLLFFLSFYVTTLPTSADFLGFFKVTS